MDLTKPILDLSSDSYSHNPTNSYRKSNNHSNHHQHRPSYQETRTPPLQASKYPQPPKEISYGELKQKYQELYQAYSEKVEKINICEESLDSLSSENRQLKQQFSHLQTKNAQLNSILLSKNTELEETYRHLQKDMNQNRRTTQNSAALEHLQQGINQAITSNYNRLRQVVTSQLKQY